MDDSPIEQLSLYEDLADIQQVTEDHLITALRDRFLGNQLYTRIGTSSLLFINPYKDCREEIEQISQNYLAEYKITDNRHEKLPAHIFQHVNQSYFHMRRTGSNQSIILSGLCGSGKSEMHQWILYHLITLSSSKKPSKIQQMVQKAYSVLEAFSHAKNTINENASCSAKYLSLQFNERGRMLGAKFSNYTLDKSRIVNASGDERNFHIFYYILFGSSSEERAGLHLNETSNYPYLFKTREAARLANGLATEYAEKYKEMKILLQSLGIGKSTLSQISQIIAAILHLGNIQFVDDTTNQQDSAIIKTQHELEIVADLLGVDSKALEVSLTYQTKLIKRDLTTIFLNAEQAYVQRDVLAETLYTLLFAWITTTINKKLCKEEYRNLIGIVDFPGALVNQENGSFSQLCALYANEKLSNFLMTEVFEKNVCLSLKDQESSSAKPFLSTSAAQDLMIEFINLKDPSDAQSYMNTCRRYANTHSNTESKVTLNDEQASFTIQHFAGPVTYSAEELAQRSSEKVRADFVSLLGSKGPINDYEGSSNSLIRKMFSQKFLSSLNTPETNVTVPPKSAEPKSESSKTEPEITESLPSPNESVPVNKFSQFKLDIGRLFETLATTKNWFVLCLRSNDLLLPNSCDAKKLTAQVKLFKLLPLVEKARHEYTIQMSLKEFCERYIDLIHATSVDLDADATEKWFALKDAFDWDDQIMVLHTNKVYLRESGWTILENKLRSFEKREQKRARCIAKGIPFVDDIICEDSIGQESTHIDSTGGKSNMEVGSVYSDGYHDNCYPEEEEEGSVCSNQCESFIETTVTLASEDEKSGYDCLYDEEGQSEFSTSTNQFNRKTMNNKEEAEAEKKPKTTRARGCWLIMTWCMTWWIPSMLMNRACGMKRSDIRMAWREKFTLCCLIFLLCAAMIWFIAFFGQLVCPHIDLYTQSELQAKNDRDNAYIAIRGEVFDLTSFAPRHWASEVIPQNALFQYAGQDASDLFPVQVSALCDGIDGNVAKEVTLDAHINLTDSNAIYHDFRSFREDYRPDWYFEQMVYLRRNYRLGFMGYDPVDIKNQATYPVQIGGITRQRFWAIIHDSVYDLTSYMMGGRTPKVAEGQPMPLNINIDFMDNSITELFRQLPGTDISAHFDALPLDKSVRERQLICLRNLFLVGKVDTRNSTPCLLSEYLLLLITGFLCSVILFKFLAALRLGVQRVPEEYDKFIICQVPCYTEGEDSLRKTINSLAALKYDDKRKLLFLIADGMIVGSGNDRSTPRIVLDILGVDPNVDPQPKSFLSLGEGRKQHNMGKVFSGLYDYSGHIVPYIVVVKCGTPDERQKPGNRGKRDSQMVLMRFLNKVHYDAAMTPLELEIHHQLKNVIGVNPIFYEFVLMVDADTEVLPESLNRMVSCFVNDAKIIGLCGETMLSNEKDTWITMIQVYEYYISHHLAKAFESLFGSVTCLPGCFCMYRIRSTTRHQPLLASNQVIKDYAENRVDTLHKKNLLHLGEDRYLTTLILKHFPTYKTKFTPDAACMTNAPDQWPVLLSQRRRWINSTVHNLGELMFLPQLCGFCCFSMRFVVMLDLLSTLVMPAVVMYLGYLVYQLFTNTNQVPLMSIITLAGVYGLQAIIFILRRKWEHIGWMIVYILAIPVFSFLIPLYAFWHFDDFSWGTTRIVVGEKGQRRAVRPEETFFDPAEIPTKTWSEHEQEMAEDFDEQKTHYSKQEKQPMDYPDYAPSAYSKKIRDSSTQSHTALNPPTDDRRTFYQSQSDTASRTSAHSYHYNNSNPPMTNIAPSLYSNHTKQRSQDYYFSKPPSVRESNVSFAIPSDTVIAQEIERILDHHNLMKLTKKQVRDMLSSLFGIDMACKKEFINQCIDESLSSRL
ncbi:chitin synthase-domain-containing protein [Blakeslea trispora]|nr:chitin synthase-domain-containing protein [Blakeslea trispora]